MNVEVLNLYLCVETICEMSGTMNELRYEAHDHSNDLNKLETSVSAESITNDIYS